ncbi:hypothetical protein Adi01nite_00130 [Amorphoplanes digitatis]|nr:hypothetical protein Adi01nite_00130 [Actinoplanes digitatis]
MVQGVRGWAPVDGAVVIGEPAEVTEAPAAGDGAYSVAVGGVCVRQIVVGVGEPDPAQVAGGGGVQMAA